MLSNSHDLHLEALAENTTHLQANHLNANCIGQQ